MDEYEAGCDRDQIAFYAAFARLRMVKIRDTTCGKYNRSGTYISALDNTQRLNILCSVENLLGSP